MIDFKNYEEQTLRDAINSVINFTIQDSELHAEFSLQLKTNIVRVLEQTKNNLSSEKKGWISRFEQYKKQLREANDNTKKEYAKFTQQGAECEKLKRLRDEQYARHELRLDEQIRNMPPALKLAEDKYQEGIKRLLELKKSST